MLIAFLLLGLVPLALLPDGPEAETDSGYDDIVADDVIENPGDLLDEIDDDPSEDDDANDVLLPTDDIYLPNDGDADPEDILQPVDEDDVLTPSDGEEGDVLDPIDEPDSEIFERGVDESGTPNNGVAEIEAFDINADVLCVYLNETFQADSDSVSIKITDDGNDSEVYVEGELVAVLRGVSGGVGPEINIVNGLAAA